MNFNPKNHSNHFNYKKVQGVRRGRDDYLEGGGEEALDSPL